MQQPATNFLKIGAIGDFPEGEGRIITAARKPVAVFNVGGTLYALNNICPHMGGPIGAGALQGEAVACPYHGMRFSLTSGQSLDDFGHSLQTYTLKLENGQVFIDAWWAKR